MTDLSRRTLLKAVPLGAALPSFFARALLAADADGDRVLVLVQLDGGNDGLNTVVPFEDDAYYHARPGIAIPPGEVVRLRDGVGFNPSLAPLRAAWDSGELAVVQGVGYPNQSRSHFTSVDVWHTAAPENPSRDSGWLGRALERGSPRTLDALHLAEGPLSLALVGERRSAVSVRDAERFTVRGDRRILEAALEGGAGDRLHEFLAGAARHAYETADRLAAALSTTRGAAGYPGTPLARRLWQIARLVDAGMPTRVYAVSLAGFDTHARQRQTHDALLRVLADALAAFRSDLAARGLFERVLVLTYSEFGRRVAENRSLGTDHGAAAPMLAMGGRVDGGLVREHPSLTDLVDGDLAHHTDFRSVYTTVLHWLGCTPYLDSTRNSSVGKDLQSHGAARLPHFLR